MPMNFEQCVSNKGRVRTISGPAKKPSLKADEFVHMCFDDKGSHMGEIKKKEKKPRK